VKATALNLSPTRRIPNNDYSLEMAVSGVIFAGLKISYFGLQELENA
jgi:hypothetical protein